MDVINAKIVKLYQSSDDSNNNKKKQTQIQSQRYNPCPNAQLITATVLRNSNPSAANDIIDQPKIKHKPRPAIRPPNSSQKGSPSNNGSHLIRLPSIRLKQKTKKIQVPSCVFVSQFLVCVSCVVSGAVVNTPSWPSSSRVSFIHTNPQASIPAKQLTTASTTRTSVLVVGASALRTGTCHPQCSWPPMVSQV